MATMQPTIIVQEFVTIKWMETFSWFGQHFAVNHCVLRLLPFAMRAALEGSWRANSSFKSIPPERRETTIEIRVISLNSMKCLCAFQADTCFSLWDSQFHHSFLWKDNCRYCQIKGYKNQHPFIYWQLELGLSPLPVSPIPLISTHPYVYLV